MSIVIEKSTLKGEITIIPSKSYAHRILICSAFSNQPTKVFNLPLSEDILATIDCLKSLGVGFDFVGNDCVVTPTTIKENFCELNVRESGSTLRFFLPIVSALGGEYILRGSKRLISRPSFVLLDCLKQNGINYEIAEDYIKISGRLTSANFEIDASLSSQYLTGLMLSLPLIDIKKNIVCKKLSSSDYIEITKDVLNSFGVQTINGYNSQGKYISPKEISVEGDYSNALFFAVGGVLNGKVKIKGLNPNSCQGDKKAFEVLEKFGAKISYENGFIFEKSDLTGCSFYADAIPDAMPALSLIMASASNISEAIGVERLVIKESNRLEAIMQILEKSGIKSQSNNGKLTVSCGEFKGGLYSGYNDHRMVMALAIMGSICGNLEIEGEEAVKKSYPNFFNDFRALGGKFWRR